MFQNVPKILNIQLESSGSLLVLANIYFACLSCIWASWNI